MLESARSNEPAAQPPPNRTTVADIGRVRSIIDAIPEAVLVLDGDGGLRLTNSAADHLFSTRPVTDRADLLSRFEVVENGAGQGPPAGRETSSAPTLTVRQRNQPNRWYALRTIDLEADTDAAASSPSDRVDPTSAAGPTVVVLRDVTDSPERQSEREAFLAVLSHELRTPITTIYAGSTVLARQPELDVPRSEDLARDISAEAARLYDLVEDLLVLARLERHVLELIDEPVLLHRSVDSATRVARERVPTARVLRTGLTVPPAVHGDATYVDQVCRDLLLASLRFAGRDEADAVVVDLQLDAPAGSVTCTVSDRGPVMSPEDLARAFELPDSSATGRRAGSGIGPFVCRHLVEAMGGRVWGRNRADGDGMEFGFALRIHEAG